MENYNLLAIRLKAQRTAHNLTQRELAAKAETTAATISAYEKGLKYPALENLIKIATVLNVSIDWLCGLSDGKSAKPTTLKDVAKMMFEIGDSLNLNIQPFYGFDETYEPQKLIGYGFPIVQGGTTDGYAAFSNFLDNWIKFKDLLDSNTIDDEVYALWKEKELEKLAKYKVPLSDKNNNIDNFDFMQEPFPQ